MLYNVYKQNTPTVMTKSKNSHTKMFELDLQLVEVMFVDCGCPIEAAKAKGHIHPVVECCNGYKFETGKPLRS